MNRIRSAVLTVLALTAGLLSVTAATPSAPANAWTANKPHNVILVMVDDLSWDLVPYMSQVRAMQKRGVTFRNYYVADSLCCPSRASLLTGKFPHNTGVRTNEAYPGMKRGVTPKLRKPVGGFAAFRAYGNEKQTFAVASQKRGYRTAFIGKYMNGFEFRPGKPTPQQPGWDIWRPYGGAAYQEVPGYAIGTNGKAITGKKYATISMADDAIAAMRVKSAKPYLLEVAPYAPHSAVSGNGRRFPAHAEDLPKTKENPRGEFPHGDCGERNGRRIDCHSVRIEQLPGNRTAGINCKDSLDRKEFPKASGTNGLTDCELQQYLRDRIRMVQSVNDMIGRIRAELTRTGAWKNTYLVFTSDNGFHLGQYATKRGMSGKGSPFETDARVPLIIEGGESKPGTTRTEFAQNVDLGRTFLDMQPDRVRDGSLNRLPKQDGRSLLELIEGKPTPPHWRNWVFMEHTSNAGAGAGDPDAEMSTTMTETYQALRVGKDLFVRYPRKGKPDLIAHYKVRIGKYGRYNVRQSWDDVPAAVKKVVQQQFRDFAGCGGGWGADGDKPDPQRTSCQHVALRPGLTG